MNKKNPKQLVEILKDHCLDSISGGNFIETSVQNRDGTWSPVKCTISASINPNKKFFITFNSKFKTQNEADQYMLEYYRKPYMY